MALNDLTWQKCLADIRANGGSTPTGTITITENGEYDVAQYATADVNVNGSAEWEEAAEILLTGEEDASLSFTVSQTAITGEPPTNTFLFSVTTSNTAYIPCGLYVTFYGEDEIAFFADQTTFTDYTTDGEGNYYFQIPECETFDVTIGR